MEVARLVVMNNLAASWAEIRNEALAAVDRVGKSGWYILGDEVLAFEADLAAFWGVPHVVGCASGLDALEIALRALELRPGEKVLTTPLSAFATTLAIIRAGGVPVFCDVGDDGQMDLEMAAGALRAHPDTRFVLPVHLYGHPLDGDGLLGMAAGSGIEVVEDCAQAIGTSSSGRAAGTFGAMAATSFYPTKNLGALGDGGAVLTSSERLADRARQLRDYGQESKYNHRHLGMNSRLDELHAAVLRDALLPRLDTFLEHRRRLAERYIAGIDNGRLRVIRPGPHGRSSWHLFPVEVDGPAEEFRTFLAERGVQTGRHYPQLCSDQPALERIEHVVHESMERARRIAASEVSLPMHPYLTDAEAEVVMNACNEWTP